MRKFFSLMMAVAFLFAGVTQMWAASSTKTEGFETKTAGTNYQSTVTVSEAESDCGIGWSIYYGTVSTNDKVSGAQSAQMRYYSNKDARGYVQSTTAVEGLTNVAFKARVSSLDMKLTVSYSADGSAWEALATNVAFTTAGAAGVKDLNYDIPSGGKYIKFEVAEGSTQPTSGNIKLIIDDVVFTYAEGGDPTPEPTTRTIYLNGGGESLWNQANAVFFVHAWGGTGADVKMAQVEGDVYSAAIPSDNTQLVFVRMAPGSEAIDWDTKWNQSADQTIPAENDLFTMTSWDNGTWSKYSAGGETPEPPTPAEKDSIYFVNVPEWATPTVHLWGGTAQGTTWPGVALTVKEADKINGYDVYKYVADKGAYVNCVFSNNGAEEGKTVDLAWTSGKYYYENAWYAKEDIPTPLPDAKPLEGNIWKVTAETPVVAGSHYINETLLKMDGVYGTTLKANTRTIAGEEFTYAMQVRTDGYPTAENLVGKEKAGNTSLVITAKEDVDVTFYYNRQAIDASGTENDNKDLIVFDQAAIATKLTGIFTIDQVLEGNNYLNATKKVALKKDHVYTVTASGTTLQLHGIKLEEHFPVMQIAGAWTEWAAKDMKLAEDKLTATYEVELAKGDYEFKMIKDGAWLTKANEGQAYGLHREWPGVAGVKDNATENIKLTADAAGKYTFTWTFANDSIGIAFPDAEPVAKFYITGDSALVVDAGLDKEKAWAPGAIKSMETSYKLNLKAGVPYMLKVTVNGTWEGENNVKGYDALTTVAKGLVRGEGADNDNICFTLNTAGEVNVHYDGEYFFLNGDFYVAPEPEKKYYLKNNWNGAEDWTWKEMTKLDDGTYMLAEVVFGGTGLDMNTAESEEGKTWIAAADIETFDASYNPASLGALDTVVFFFDPEAVNHFTGANGMSAQIIGKYVAPVVPDLADGYYLIGQKGWDIYALDASLLFTANAGAEGEYVLANVILEVGQELKVVSVENKEIKTWYGSGDGNYVVTADVAGTKDVYFRPTWTTDWNGHIYIELNAPSGIDNTAVEGKAVKMIQNGQLLIIKNDKTYNVMGQMIR